MLQNDFPFSAEAGRACGSPAVAAGASLTRPAPRGGEAVPAGQPLPIGRSRREGRSPRAQCPREAAASFTPILTGLAGTVQWIYYPAPRSDF
jgi:hypothetical protein